MNQSPDVVLSLAGTPIDKSQILAVKCDVLIPAAVSGVITADNAPSLNCRFVVEAANVSLFLYHGISQAAFDNP